MSLPDLLPSHVTPGLLTQSCHFLSSCRVMSLLELVPSHATPGALAQTCYFLNSCPVMSLLEHLLSHVTSCALAQSCHSWSFHLTSGALAQSCHFWCSSRRISKFQQRNAFAQSCHSWSCCPVMTLLEPLPYHFTPGALPGEILSSTGVMLSLRRVTPAALAQIFHV